jgi:hypothetical protein
VIIEKIAFDLVVEEGSKPVRLKNRFYAKVKGKTFLF